MLDKLGAHFYLNSNEKLLFILKLKKFEFRTKSSRPAKCLFHALSFTSQKLKRGKLSKLDLICAHNSVVFVK